MAFYEVVFIIRPDVANQAAEQLAEKFGKAAQEKGGKLVKSEYWGLRTLAYRVKKHRKGHYIMLGLEGDRAMIQELERQLRLSDDVIRFLTINQETLTEEPSVMMNQKGPRSGGRPRADRPTADA